jgi:FSR family fosmidomycin resistance protein-like MFS transporter
LTYSLIHFVVDFSCMALVVSLAVWHHVSLFLAIVSYNFFAFFMQMPLGIVADRFNKNALVSAAGCMLVILAFACWVQPFYACVIAGLGNALFHLGGGIDVLNLSPKRATSVGIFVATGALGLFFGRYMLDYTPLVIGLLLTSTVLLCCLYVKIHANVSNLPMQWPTFTKGKAIVAGCLICTVCLRSYVGCLTAFSWKTGFGWSLLAVGAVVLGKMLGGLIGDRLGFVRTATVSLLVASGMFLFAFDHTSAGILALIGFNMTMPLTLSVLARLMPHNKGFAFGILTAALFVGSVPAFLGVKLLASPVGLSMLGLISAALLVPALRWSKKYVD